jgi:hypothetical protein
MPKTQVPMDFNNEFATELGRLVAHWAVVESCLTRVLAMLLGIQDQVRGQFVFMSFVSLKSKLELIERLAETFLVESLEKAQLVTLLKESSRLNKLRNDNVHAQWGPSVNKGALSRWPSSLPGNFKKQLFKDTEEITVQDIRDVVEQIAELTSAFVAFEFDSVPKLQTYQGWPKLPQSR